MVSGKMLDGRFLESIYGIRINVGKIVTIRSLNINSVLALVNDAHLCLCANMKLFEKTE